MRMAVDNEPIELSSHGAGVSSSSLLSASPFMLAVVSPNSQGDPFCCPTWQNTERTERSLNSLSPVSFLFLLSDESPAGLRLGPEGKEEADTVPERWQEERNDGTECQPGLEFVFLALVGAQQCYCGGILLLRFV